MMSRKRKENRKKFIVIGLLVIGITISAFLVFSFMMQEPSPEGNYPGTYSFTDDPVGASGTEISWVKSGTTTSEGAGFEIVEYAYGHYKCLKMYSDGVGIAKYDMVFENRESGTIEFWLYTEKGGCLMAWFGVPYSSGFIFTWNLAPNPGIFSIVKPLPKWQHVRIDFECGSDGYMDLEPDRFRVTIDGSQPAPDLGFSQPQKVLGVMTIATRNKMETVAYIDAVGYSWDLAYEIGNNKIPL